MTSRIQSKQSQNKSILNDLKLLNSKIQKIRTFLAQQGYSSPYIQRHLTSIIQATKKFRKTFYLSNSNICEFLKLIMKDLSTKKQNIEQLVTLFDIHAQKCCQQVYKIDPLFEVKEQTFRTKLNKQKLKEKHIKQNEPKVNSSQFTPPKKSVFISSFEQSINDSILKTEMLNEYVQSKLRITDIYRQRLQKMTQQFDQLRYQNSQLF